MDPPTENLIQQTVIQILKNSDLDKVTRFMVRQSASEKLKMDLSDPKRKKFVRKVIESFIMDEQVKIEAAQVEQGETEEEDNENDNNDDNGVEYDDDGNPIICRMSNNRRVTVSEFKGKTLVSIREYYNNGTKELPTPKGISLTVEQWAALKKDIPAIEKAIKKMESRFGIDS